MAMCHKEGLLGKDDNEKYTQRAKEVWNEKS